MKVLIIYAHPWEKSFNHAILENVIKTLKDAMHEVDILDLNQEQFNPTLTKGDLGIYSKGESTDSLVQEYQKKIMDAQHLVLIFPIWWTDAPAILKGFFDKVLLRGFAFEKGPKFPLGLLKHIEGASVFTTMSSPKIYYSFYLKNPVKQSIIKGTLRFCGIKHVKWYPLGSIDRLSPKRAEKWLEKVAKIIRKISA